MKKNIMIVGLIAAAVLIGIMFLGRSNEGAKSSQAESTPESALSAPATLYDFGVISSAMDRPLLIENPKSPCRIPPSQFM